MSDPRALPIPNPEREERRAPRALHPEMFGDLLRRYRIAAGLTQEELAERATLSIRAIGDIERGVKQRPHRDTVLLLAHALALSDEERDDFIAAARQRRAAAPALASVTLVPANLPAQVTPLIGRAEAVRAVCAMLRDEHVRLLTITGPGGVGKTRFAVAVADALSADPLDGIVFVPLAAARDPGLVPSAIAQALGIRERAGEPLEGAIFGAIGRKRLLLVLDNFEHLLPATPLVGAALAACARLKVLVTSRAALRAYGEHEFPLAPLAVPDARARADVDTLAHVPAVDLFVQRARAIHPDFRLTPSNATAVADICLRLDGLPLALELAAARTRLLSPKALLDRLGNRLHLLTTGPVDRPARQQTMRGAIAWSHDLLTDDERRLFRRLAVFAGSWTVAAAETVCATAEFPPAAILDRLEVLLDQHLLHAERGVETETRIGMLETIHEYAVEQLAASGERQAIERQHAAYFLARAEDAEPQLRGGEQLAWLTWLETEHDNLRAALTWARDAGEIETGVRLAGALARFWYIRGYQSEGSVWLEEFLARDATANRHARAKALFGAGMLAYARTDFPHALDLLGASTEMLREREDQPLLADTLTFIGATLTDMGDYARAAALHEESLIVRRAIGDQAGIGASLNNLANIERHHGDRLRALRLYEEALAIRRKHCDSTNSAIILSNMGQLLRELGEYPRAEAVLTESIELHGGKGDKGQIALALSNLGTIARDQGDYPRARENYDRCLAVFREIGSKAEIARTLINLARVERETGSDECAAILAEESLALAQATRHQRNTAYALLCTADIARQRGKPGVARARYLEGLESFRAAGNPLGITEAIELLGLLIADTGNATAAARFLGFSAASRARMRTPIPPVERDERGRAIIALQRTLGAEAFAAAWEAGAALSTDGAIAEALE